MFDWQVKLNRLPRWAVVAIAARCARRVQKLFSEWPGATKNMYELIERSIAMAETAGHANREAESTIVDRTHLLARAADRAGEPVAYHAAEAANHAAVAGVALSVGICPRGRSIKAAESALEALNLSDKSSKPLLDAFMASLRADIDRVQSHLDEGCVGDLRPEGNYFGDLWLSTSV